MSILESIRLWRYWSYRARLNYDLRYRSSRLGQLWPVLSLLIVASVIGLIWGTLLDKEDKVGYFIYLVCGFPIWAIISAAVDQGCRDINIKTSGGIPFFTIILERTSSVFLAFLYVLPVIILIVAFNAEIGFQQIILFPLFLLCLVMWVIGSVSFLISIVSIYPDLKHMIGAVMRLSFLATPIIWEASRLGQYEKYIWYNPFYLPLESLRCSLLGSCAVDSLVWVYFPIYSILLLSIGVYLLSVRAMVLTK